MIVDCCRLMALTIASLSMVAGSVATNSRNRVFDMKWGCAFSLMIAFGSKMGPVYDEYGMWLACCCVACVMTS